MVSNGNNCFQLFESCEDSVEIKKELPFNNDDPIKEADEEPVIEVKIEEPGDGDPVLTAQIEDSNNSQISLNRNSLNPPRTYSNIKLKDGKKMKVLPQLPLKSMVIEALKGMRKIKGCTSRDVKKFIAKKYDIEFKIAQITQELQKAAETRDILQLKRGHTRVPMRRYRLSNLNLSRAKQEANNMQNSISLDQSMSIEIKEENTLSDLEDNKESVFGNDIMKSSGESEEIEIIYSSFLAADNTAGLKLETLPANVSSLESRVQKQEDNSISTDEIGFMVLHALCSPPNLSGMRLDEIAEFILSFYNIDEERSLPCIEKYLNYSIKKGILLKIGDRYKKIFPMTNFSSNKPLQQTQMNSYTNNGDNMGNNESSCLQNNFFSPEIKSEPEERELSSLEIDSNYQSMGKVPMLKVAKVVRRKYKPKKKRWSSKKNVSTSKRARNKLPPNNPDQQERLCQLNHDGYEASREYVKVEGDYIQLATNAPYLVPFKSTKVVPPSSQSTKSPVVRKWRNEVPVTKLQDSFHGHDYSLYRNANKQYPYNLRLKKPAKSESEFDCDDNSDVYFDVRYTLDEINEYISRYPEILAYNAAVLLRDVSWERFSLTMGVSCLKLIGNTVLSDESLYCNICASELKFGSFYCEACCSEMENVILKCNICNLICNRRDVFYKHFIWEHKVSSEPIDYEAASLVEENIDELFTKLVNDDKYHCRLCILVANDKEAFENHITWMHMSTVNVFPPLPKESFPGELVILQDQITHGCCHKCNGCKFISNRRDFVLYHILDAHKSVLDDCYNDQSSSCVVEPKCQYKRRVKWTFGLCYVCGNFYNNVTKHLERHGIVNIPNRLDMNANKSNQTQNISPLDDKKQSVASRLPETTIIRRRRNNKPTGPCLCHVCGKILKCKLWQHLRIHNNEIYDCNVCGRKFNRHSNLITHKRVHTREKPYQCDICKMRFGYKCSIKGHIVNVHSETVT